MDNSCYSKHPHIIWLKCFMCTGCDGQFVFQQTSPHYLTLKCFMCTVWFSQTNLTNTESHRGPMVEQMHVKHAATMSLARNFDKVEELYHATPFIWQIRRHEESQLLSPMAVAFTLLTVVTIIQTNVKRTSIICRMVSLCCNEDRQALI